MGMEANIGTALGSMAPGGGLLSGIGQIMQGSDKKPKMIPNAPDPNKPGTAHPNSFKHGGVVEKTGLALVHKGETVIPVTDHKAEKTDTVHLSDHRVVMHLKKGGLHRALGIPEGTKIPEEKIDAARNSSNPHLRAMATLAHTMAGWHKK